MKLPLVPLFLLVTVPSWVQSSSDTSAPRPKRALLFQQGGTATILAALAIPVDIESPHTFVSINYAANYATPQNSTWFTQPFNRFHLKNKREVEVKQGGISRSSLYKMIIQELDKFGFNGKWCLLSTICEINSLPVSLHNGLTGSVMQLLFSPSLSGSEKGFPEKFFEAERNGQDLNCEKYLDKCPLNILDLISHFQ